MNAKTPKESAVTQQLGSSLEYQSAPAPRRRMTLEMSEVGATLVFPVVHPALAIPGIAFSLVAAAAMAFTLAYILRFAIRWQIDLQSVGWLKTILTYVLGLVFWGTVATFEIIIFRRARRVPQRLGFERDELFREQPTWRGVSHRRWRLDDVVEARCADLRSIVPGLVGAELLIRLRSKRLPLRFRLSGYKVALGHQFVEQLNAAMRRTSL